MEDTPTMVFQNDDSLYETGLFGTKEAVALALCGVDTVGAFAAMDLGEVVRLRGYGRATRRRLEKIQRRLRASIDLVPSDEEKR